MVDRIYILGFTGHRLGKHIFKHFHRGRFLYFDFATLHGKQFFFIGVSFVTIIILLALDAGFYERFSSIFYVISMALLLGLFVFGKTIAGATSWYDLGFFNFQPSELAKVATALALAKYLSDIQTDLKRRKDQLYAFFGIVNTCHFDYSSTRSR